MTPSLSSIKAFAIDGDGVLYRGNTPMPGLADFFAFLRQQSMPFTLVTNNATKTQRDFSDKLARFGVKISPAKVITSSTATAEYLQSQYPAGTQLFVLGRGVRHAVQAAGFVLADSEVAAVVVGMDFDINYKKLHTATTLITGGARFIGTNPDRSFPFEGGIAPGNGAILAALEAATGVAPFVIGKPYPPMFRSALAHMGVDAAHAAIIGDRLETDILGGNQLGMHSILVMSGVTTRDMVAAGNIQPDWVFDDIATLLAAMRDAE